MWNDQELINLFLKKTPLIDVRAGIEFHDGSIPYSVNLPILDDHERALIGTCYKELGKNEAIKLGHHLINGEIKEKKIDQWTTFLKKFPDAEIFCFRGGLRSQITCQWLKERGFEKKPIEDGYKRLRNFFLSWLEEAPRSLMTRISGPTGSGKTDFIKNLPNHIDLEKLANHKGSAFGFLGTQPTQITFENSLALELIKLKEQKIIVEDESATIGKIFIPRYFFSAMRSSEIILLETTIDKRLHNIYNDYVINHDADFFTGNLQKIAKKFGNLNSNQLIQEINRAFSRPMDINNHANWILKLLKGYYDPLYQKDLRRNKDKIIFSGTEKEIFEYVLFKNSFKEI
jgi:tRNA 2-selenouridine synthase